MTSQDTQALSPLQLKLVMIPNAVYEAAQRSMRSNMLDHYIGGSVELREAPRLGYIQVLTSYVQGVSSAAARRMLDRCAFHHGSFIEQRRVSPTGIRVWHPAPWLYEHLRAEALAHWQKVGYGVGQRVPEIATDGAPA